MIGLLVLWHGIRRIRRNLEPGQDQAEFAETLQIAGDEDEAHQLLQRHLERTLPATSAVVLNRNNSADRLEAVTPLPPGSPLAQTLRGAEPRSCLAVRSGRTHGESGGRAPLLSCPVCAPVPGVLVLRSAHGRRRGDRLRPAQPPDALFGGRGTADPRVGQPGGAGPGQPAQPGRGGDPRRHRRAHRAAQQARRHRRAEADVRAGRDDQRAARPDPARPGPLQAGQRPGRARRGGPGARERRRDAPRRAAGQGLRRPQRRRGVRGPAAGHRDRRGA